MTQSGQGGEPSARPAHEGIVLPSDGGAPLLPGDLPPAPVPPRWGTEPPAAQPPADPWNAAPPMPQWGDQGAQSVPLPPEVPPVAPLDEGVTQYIPPVPAAGAMPVDEAATQYIPHIPQMPPAPAAPAAEDATQYLPPVGPGALPPEAPSDATTFLGRVPNAGAGPLPSTAHPGQPAHPDAEATQYIPPVAAQPQQQAYGAPAPQQPDVFDNLFRSDQGDPGGTQHLPRVEGPPPVSQPPQPPYGGRGAARRDGGGGGRSGKSRVPLIAGVGIVIAALGIGAGALMGGGSEDDQQSDNKTVSASESAPEESASPSADPAQEQAVALDKLLADSGNSRNSVIKAVANIKACKNLGQAATDLRNAAQQRGDLVTRLGGLSVDKLPENAVLTTALTNAWKASASADNHYAAWADQAAKKKGCKKGQARTTPQTQAGNQASATASAEKTKAARLWNGIASTYGLTQRQAGQL
ncbi:hypothetical protein [Streptomyces tailanensis]|uniref:hypothetical protein n=1 Tax=Streptomyces tailanensis TaxID=2569858 RepID=UPI00122E5C45|nr:hypothetical protein [Streptomyces tailanensis]